MKFLAFSIVLIGTTLLVEALNPEGGPDYLGAHGYRFGTPQYRRSGSFLRQVKSSPLINPEDLIKAFLVFAINSPDDPNNSIYPEGSSVPSLYSATFVGPSGYPSNLLMNSGYPSATSGYPAEPSGYPSAPSGYPADPSEYPSAPFGYPADPSVPSGYPSGAPGTQKYYSSYIYPGPSSSGSTYEGSNEIYGPYLPQRTGSRRNLFPPVEVGGPGPGPGMVGMGGMMGPGGGMAEMPGLTVNQANHAAGFHGNLSQKNVAAMRRAFPYQRAMITQENIAG